MRETKRVAVTGVGLLSPLGVGASRHWDSLLGGTSGVSPIKAFDPSGFGCRVAGAVGEYRMADFVPKSYRKATKLLARDTELAVIAADDAVRSAGLKTRGVAEAHEVEIDPTRFGCNIGAGLISTELNELTAALDKARAGDDSARLDLARWGNEGMGHLTPLWLLKYLPNMLACHVTIVHGLMGPSNTITCGDASGHLAIGEAYRSIQRGKADLAICGGAESKLNPMGMMRQQLLGRLNTRDNDRPAEAVRPFAPDAAGTAVGEAGGLLVLEAYDHAVARGATILAELVGFSASQDAYSVTDPDPTGRSYAAAVRHALRECGASARDVGLLVPHGLGVRSHDDAELAGLRGTFGDVLGDIPTVTTKTATGDLAAGCAADAVTAVLALAHATIPPSLTTAGVPLNVASIPRPLAGELAITTAYSLGGQNAALVFRRATDS